MAAGRKIEVEMKYKVATAGAGDRYLVAPALGSFVPDGPVRSVQMEDRYVDFGRMVPGADRVRGPAPQDPARNDHQPQGAERRHRPVAAP